MTLYLCLLPLGFFLLFIILLIEDHRQYQKKITALAKKKPEPKKIVEGNKKTVFEVKEEEAAKIHAFNPFRPFKRR